MIKKFFQLLLMTIMISFLIACSSKVSQSNYDKINNGMPKSEVIKILGDPTETMSLGLGEFSGTTAIWKDKDSRIVIQFLNDKVAMKNYIKGSEDSSE